MLREVMSQMYRKINEIKEKDKVGIEIEEVKSSPKRVKVK